MHVQIQNPFEFQLYLIGREYLKQALDKELIKYESYDNCLPLIEDIEKAQEIIDKLENKKWDRFSDVIIKKINPLFLEIENIFHKGYKWCIHQCEYSSDIMLKKREELESIYPKLI